MPSWDQMVQENQTLSAVLTGNPLYTVTDGSAIFNGKDLLELGADERANEGIFLSFQYPVEIPGEV